MKKSWKRTGAMIGALLLALFLTCCATPPRAAVSGAESPTAAAWAALWADRFAEAEKSFADALKADPRSAEAARGLGLALFARGAVFEAAEKLLSSIAAAPNTELAVAVRSFVSEQIPYRESLGNRLKDVDGLLARPRNSPWVRREGIRRQAWYAGEVASDAAGTRKLAGQLGVVTGWKQLGPLPSVSGAGFDHAFIDEADLKAAVGADLQVPSLDNLPAKWVKPSLEEPDGTIEIARRLKGRGGCAYYAAATHTVPTDADYWIIVDRAGALRLWIDGAVVLSDAGDLAGDEMHWIKKRLSRGEHQVVVKLADDLFPARFRISIERAFLDASADTAAELVLAALPEFPGPSADPMLARLAVQASQSGQVEGRYWLAYLLAEKGYARAALAQLAEGRRRGGGAGLALARIIEARCHSLLGRRDDARNALAGPRTGAVAFAPTSDLLLAEALANGRTKELERLLAESEKSLGRRYRADIYGVLLAGEQGKDLYAKLEELRRKYPDVPELYGLLLSGRVRGLNTAKILGEMTEKKLPTSIRLEYVDRLMDWGSYGVAYTQAQRIVGVLPSNDRLRANALRAGYYSHARTYVQSTGDVDGLLGEFPRSWPLLDLGADVANAYVSYLEAQAGSKPSTQQTDELTKERTRFGRYLTGLLALDPGDFASRERLRDLRGEERISALVRVSDPFSVIDSYEKTAPQATGDVVRVLDEEVLIFFEDGGRRMYRQQVLKIMSRNGARRESSQELDVDALRERFWIERAILLKPDGTRTSAKVVGHRISFAGLDSGDYLLLSYVVDGSQPGSLRGKFWAQITLNSFYPVHVAEYRIIHPEAATPKVVYHNVEGVTSVQSNGSPLSGYKEIRISVADAKPLRFAAALPSWRDVLAWVDVSSVPDWPPIADWYRDLSAGRSAPTQRIHDVVNGLTTGASGREEVISRLYDYVSNKIDYEDLSFQYSAYVPQKPDSVIDDRYGDCKDKSALLVAMLRSAGIQSWMALSDPSYAGENVFLPSTRFTHTIVVVPGAGPGQSDLLLDPTSGYLTYPELPPSLAGTWYLPIPPDAAGPTTALRRIERGAQQPASEILLEIEAKPGQTNVKASAVLHGVHAAQIRSILQSRDAELRKAAFSLYAAQGIPGFKLGDYAVSNLDSVLSSPVAEFSGEAPGAIVGGSILALPWFVALPLDLLDVARAAPRDAPLRLDEPQLQTPWHQTCIIALPKDYRVASLPADLDLRFGGARATFRFAVKGDRVVCEKEVYIPLMSVAPADLPALDAFLAAGAAKQQEMVRLVAEAQ
jgi:transglutaminase-like putative cysteine protease